MELNLDGLLFQMNVHTVESVQKWANICGSESSMKMGELRVRKHMFHSNTIM